MSRLQTLSSCFAQLTHKSQTIFQSNAKLEAEVVHLRHEAAHSIAQLRMTQQQHKQQMTKLTINIDQQCDIESTVSSSTNELQALTENCANDTTEPPSPSNYHDCDNDVDVIEVPASAIAAEESRQLQLENTALRRLMLAMQGELCGARLAAKYLDKELAGR